MHGDWQASATSSRGASSARLDELLPSRPSTHARAHCSHSSIDKLTRAAPWSLFDIIRHCKPMRIPQRPCVTRYSVIYTDAYFKIGQLKLRPGDDELPERFPDVRQLEQPASSTEIRTRQRTSKVVCLVTFCCNLAMLNLSFTFLKPGCP